MIYTIKNHETLYNNIKFRSRLEARWAAFFDLCEWEWEYEPIDLKGWTPDFRVSFPCGHSECPDKHVLLVEVKPYYNIEDFEGHPCTKYYWNCLGGLADSSACFGINPTVTYWEMCHGSGGGTEHIENWLPKESHYYESEYYLDILMKIWYKAGNIVRYK